MTIYWIWLSILNLSHKQKIQLLNFFKEPQKIYNLDEKQLSKLTDSKELIKHIIDKSKKEEAKIILENSINQKIQIITFQDSKYPTNLKHIKDFPLVLYLKGNEKILNQNKKIAIIGSRACSEYGKKTTLRLSYLLARKDYVIISGLAKGIDAYAHKGTLAAKGKTIAILGSGINYIYPKENEKLYNEILAKDGLILSEYPLNTKPLPEYFPKRNRIISGLSDKILITEASKNSGSIITAHLGLEQGKDIYALPGNITSYKSEGCNNLIKEGAFLLTSLEDIFDL